MDKIGLFPLATVLFPESSLPLYIFEVPYIKLIKHCWDEKKVFGINYVTAQKMYETGCSAEVTDIIKVYEDGKMEILVTGGRRYRLKHYSQSSNLFYEADIEYIDEINEPLNNDVLTECVDLYNNIAEVVKTINISKIDINNFNTKMPSFFIAQKSGLTMIQKQKLLEFQSENQRLSFLLSHLKHLHPMLKEAEYISKIIKNDGYYRK
jgi:Lon protease-like protein